ncbi:MAG: hypothetical protein WDM85_14350 [Caulobacteraceae bacterium]
MAIDIYYESHGPESAEPILLIMGLGAQMSRWSPELIGKLTGAGHRVIAFDNRGCRPLGKTRRNRRAGHARRGGRHARRPSGPRSPTPSITWPPTPPGCSMRSASNGLTSLAPRWAG